MQVQIPGIAFGAMKDSDFPKNYPDVWKRLLDYSITLARGRGITVHITLDYSDWAVLREAMLTEVRRLHAMSYQERGMEGSVVMRSLQVAIGRVDEVVK